MIILVMAAALLTAISVVDYLQKLYLLHSVITEYSALEAIIATSATINSRENFWSSRGVEVGEWTTCKGRSKAILKARKMLLLLV
jgi:hypothetical protein